MNVVKAYSFWHGVTGFFTNFIDNSASHINKELVTYINGLENKYSYPIPNEWTIMDYPSSDVVRAIYNLNDLTYADRVAEELEKNKVEILGFKAWTDSKYFFSSIFSILGKRDQDSNTTKACLQRKLLIDKDDNHRDLIKTSYKCVENELNQWRIKISDEGKFYSIISVYDDKCLSYSDNTWNMQKCEKNNKDIDFIIKEGRICARLNESKCIDGRYDLIPVISKSPIYNNLTCSMIFAMHGIKCCSDPNTEVSYVDNFGNWGIENGKLCGIGYTRCAWSTFGYPCCSSVNPEVQEEDARGSYGIQDDNWCGIGEPIYDTNVRIKNKKTQECLITNLHSDDTVLLLGDCNHSIWTYENEMLTLKATGKCLFAMNSQNVRMTECDKGDEQINHHIHFKIVDNKYI